MEMCQKLSSKDATTITEAQILVELKLNIIVYFSTAGVVVAYPHEFDVYESYFTTTDRVKEVISCRCRLHFRHVKRAWSPRHPPGHARGSREVEERVSLRSFWRHHEQHLCGECSDGKTPSLRPRTAESRQFCNSSRWQQHLHGVWWLKALRGGINLRKTICKCDAPKSSGARRPWQHSDTGKDWKRSCSLLWAAEVRHNAL